MSKKLYIFQDDAGIKQRTKFVLETINELFIDRILFEWKKNGIKTLEQVRKQTQKFRAYQKRDRTQEQTSSVVKDIPFYNWLEQ